MKRKRKPNFSGFIQSPKKQNPGISAPVKKFLLILKQSMIQDMENYLCSLQKGYENSSNPEVQEAILEMISEAKERLNYLEQL